MPDVNDIPVHIQDGKTALPLVCATGHAAAAAELIEATNCAGALDLQVAREAWLGACVA